MGISCPKCYDKLSVSQKERFAMRQKQILLAKKWEKIIYLKKNIIEVQLENSLNITSRPIILSS